MIIIGVDFGSKDKAVLTKRDTDTGRISYIEDDEVQICRDFDEDCADLDHLHCFLYDPAKGKCPFLCKWNR